RKNQASSTAPSGSSSSSSSSPASSTSRAKQRRTCSGTSASSPSSSASSAGWSCRCSSVGVDERHAPDGASKTPPALLLLFKQPLQLTHALFGRAVARAVVLEAAADGLARGV